MALFRRKPVRRRRGSRAARLVLMLAIAVLLLPYALVVLYRVINPVSTLMVWRWLSGQRVERSYVALAEMPPSLPLAVIAAEDGRYCLHRGIDFQALRNIVEEAEELDDLRGGSSITQQTVKNLFLWHGRSFLRKALEFPLALWADLVLPKRRILEIYLNIAEWGPAGQFGAQAAARYAFGKRVQDLTRGEAALLAAVLPNPLARSARLPRPSVLRLAAIYDSRAAASPWIGECIRGRRTP